MGKLLAVFLGCFLLISVACDRNLTVSPKTYYIVDTLQCIGCGRCVDSCSFNAITLDTITWKARIDTSRCTECGICKRVCPNHAIKDTAY